MCSAPLTLYIHLPWCERKCPYCDFNSHALHGSIPQEQYIQTLLLDLDADLKWGQRALGSRSLQSIFLGGGTPSLFAPQMIGRLLDGINKRIDFCNDIEITLEANPGSSEQKHFSALRQAGVNRLSLGIQSFSNDSLQALGRIHNAAEAKSAIASAQLAGFDNINLDLMYGLPGQTLKMAEYDLNYAVSVAPKHISAYQLTLEPNTLFFVKRPELPDEAEISRMEELFRTLLSEHRYQRYEISAYSKPQAQCVHNLNYWNYGDYLGIGAGAHAKLSCQDNEVWRLTKHRDPDTYMRAGKQKMFCSSQRKVAGKERIFEFMLNALRLVDGFTKETFVQTTGLSFEKAQHTIGKLVQRGLLMQTAQRVYASPKGLAFLNDIQLEFLPGEQ